MRRYILSFEKMSHRLEELWSRQSMTTTVDITRWPNHHVAFGSGVRHCQGATLARLEGQEAFKGLVQRFPGLRMETEEVEYHPTINLRSIKTLPVTWH